MAKASKSTPPPCTSCGEPVDTTYVHYYEADGLRHIDCPPVKK